MTLTYKTTIILERYGYTYDYDGEQYYWGAPLDGLNVTNIRYSGNEAIADIVFDNDSPTNLDLTFDVAVYNSAGTLIGETQESYFVPPGASVDDTISATLNGVPDYAVVTITEDVSGFQYQEEVDVYG